MTIEIVPLRLAEDISESHDLAALVLTVSPPLHDGDIVVVTLRESRRILRQRGPLLVVETNRGLVCANAGVDRSNAPRPDAVVLLPSDPDASADRLRAALQAQTGARLGVVVADTMGRAFRE